MAHQIQRIAEFGYELRGLRERAGLTQVEVAESAGVSIRWLSNFERGKSPRAELVKVLSVARSLGYSFELHPDRSAELAPDLQIVADLAEGFSERFVAKDAG